MTEKRICVNEFGNFSNKIKWINLFFSITVVAMHCVRVWEMYYGKSDSVISFLFVYLETFAMTFFFLMSGFWLFYSYGKYNYFEMIKKKIHSVFMPYILWGVLKVITVQIWSLIEKRQLKYSMLDSVKNLLFIKIGPISFEPLNGPVWYLIRIMSYFIVAPILYYLIKDKLTGIISLFVLVTISSMFGYYTFGRWLFVFCFGGYMGLHYKETIIKASNRLQGIPVIIILFIYIALCALYPYLNMCEIIKKCDNIIEIVVILSVIIFWKNPSTEMKHSNYSFILYCSHIIWITFLAKITHSLLNDFINAGICQSIILLSCCLIVAVMYLMLRRFSPVLYKLLVGGR